MTEAGTRVDATGEAHAETTSETPSAAVSQAKRLMAQARQHVIAELDKSIAELTSLRGALLVAERESAEWKRRGHPTFEAWRGQSAGVGLREARTEVRVATTLDEQPRVGDAVKNGDITLEHANVNGKVADQAVRRRAALNSVGHQQLLELAKKHDADAFAKAADRWLAARDPLGHDSSHEEIRQRRYLSVTHTPTGTHTSRASSIRSPVRSYVSH